MVAEPSVEEFMYLEDLPHMTELTACFWYESIDDAGTDVLLSIWTPGIDIFWKKWALFPISNPTSVKNDSFETQLFCLLQKHIIILADQNDFMVIKKPDRLRVFKQTEIAEELFIPDGLWEMPHIHCVTYKLGEINVSSTKAFEKIRIMKGIQVPHSQMMSYVWWW